MNDQYQANTEVSTASGTQQEAAFSSKNPRVGRRSSTCPLGAMIVLSWNGKGLARPHAKKALHYVIRRNKLDVVCLMKTKISATASQSLRQFLGFKNVLFLQ